MQKKPSNKKLVLTTNTLRTLSARDLVQVAGGGHSHEGTCGSSCRHDD